MFFVGCLDSNELGFGVIFFRIYLFLLLLGGFDFIIFFECWLCVSV